jgi:hypothetical protein
MHFLEILIGPKHGFSLHGLRGGGATQHWLIYHDVLRLQRLGRWCSDTSLNSYIQIQAALLGSTGWSPETTKRIASYACRINSKVLDFE